MENAIPETSNPELYALSEQLWTLDNNNRVPFCEMQINKTPGSPFIGNIPDSYLQKNTYKTFIDLLDNYDPWTGTAEPYCEECLNEQDEFLNAIMETEVMKLAWEFLKNKSLANESLPLFKKELLNNWFYPYIRSHSVYGSSGFEHVFSGETRGKKIQGFHNWIKLYLLEKSGHAKFMKHVKHCPPNREAVSIEWDNKFKKKSMSMFLGSSPEFEMAIYTVCFRVRKNKPCKLRLNGNKAAVHTWGMNALKNVDTIGTAFPYCP